MNEETKHKSQVKRPTRPLKRHGSADPLHAALTPMADGCAKTAILAFALCGTYSKNAAIAVKLAGETLAKINAIIRDGQNAKLSGGEKEKP